MAFEIWRYLVEDYRRMRPESRWLFLSFLMSSMSNPGLQAAFFLRLQMFLVAKRRLKLAGLVRGWCLMVTGADFVPGCVVGPGVLMHHPNGIVLGAGARVGAACTLLQQVTLGERHADGSGDHKYPVVDDNCTIGAGARILGPVLVGVGAAVGANAVVLSDVPAASTVVGIPAVVVRKVSPSSVRESE